jgi:hypothetical protein
MSDKSSKIARDYLTFLKNAFFDLDEEIIRSFWDHVGEDQYPRTITDMFVSFDRKLFTN